MCRNTSVSKFRVQIRCGHYEGRLAHVVSIDDDRTPGTGERGTRNGASGSTISHTYTVQFRYWPDYEWAFTRQMKVSHRSRRRITTLSRGAGGLSQGASYSVARFVLVSLTSLLWLNIFKGFSMRRRNIFFFSFFARPEEWFPEDHCDYRRALPTALRDGILPGYPGKCINGKRKTGVYRYGPDPHPRFDLLLQLFKCYSAQRATQSNTSKIFLIKTYQSTFHITFSKKQQHQQQQQQLHSKSKVTIVLIIGRGAETTVELIARRVLWCSLAADWTPPRYGYLSRVCVCVWDRIRVRIRIRIPTTQPHRRQP